MTRIPITTKGLKQLEDERNKLKNIDRPSIIKAISEARELGDLSENAEYHAAREQQGFIEGKIKELDDVIARCEAIDTASIVNDKIIFGATVDLINLETDEKKTYQIVGEYEANIDLGLISYHSPLGKGLIGKTQGDIVDINTSKAVISWEVLKVLYK
jgi:transcription elongation factor GreA